ncbi:MAG: carbohydrate kinase family protein [Acholeplasmataceae bacterium]|nr:carbohydrate kinase family protein [Acholeplasmataceae bacterium]
MRALVLGTAGVQVNIPIESFPYHYKSIHFMDDKVEMDIAGVGYSHLNILGKLGDEVTFLTGIGNDVFGQVVKQAIINTNAKCIIEKKDKATLVSTILYDKEGNRSILREGRKDYLYKMKHETYKNLSDDFDVALFSMAGFSRDLLHVVSAKKIPIATDLQDVSNLSNEYGRDFMNLSDIIFFSDDNFKGDIHLLVSNLYKEHNYKIIGVGLGNKGCLLCENGNIQYYPAISVNVVNTVGAGDALFACFIHCYFNGDDADTAIMKAQIFASNKIRYKTASQGFLDKETLNNLYKEYDKE